MKKLIRIINKRYRRFDDCMTEAEYHLSEANRLVELYLQYKNEDSETAGYYRSASLQMIKKAEDFKRHADCYLQKNR